MRHAGLQGWQQVCTCMRLADRGEAHVMMCPRHSTTVSVCPYSCAAALLSVRAVQSAVGELQGVTQDMRNGDSLPAGVDQPPVHGSPDASLCYTGGGAQLRTLRTSNSSHGLLLAVLHCPAGKAQ
mgnify:FL=1